MGIERKGEMFLQEVIGRREWRRKDGAPVLRMGIILLGAGSWGSRAEDPDSVERELQSG